MQFPEFVEWVFYGLIGGAAYLASGSLKKIQESIESMSKHLAQVVEKIAWHEREIERHHARIERLEEERSKFRCIQDHEGG